LKAEDLVPPCDLAAEQALLGAMLVNPSAIGAVSDLVTRSDFYKSINGDIFTTILGAWTSSTQSADVVTIGAQFPDEHDYIVGMAEQCPAASNATYYADIVKRTSTQRDLIKAGHEIVELGYKTTDEPQTLLDAAEAKVYKLRPDAAGDTISLARAAEAIYDECLSGKVADSVKTGFRLLDEQTSGMHHGNLIIIGARPGIGKTCLALNIARNVSREGTVAFFSLEMSQQELSERVICSIGEVSLTRLRQRDSGPEQLASIGRAVGEMAALDMQVIDNPSLTLLSLKSRARQLAARKQLKLIVVDYLQLLTHGTRQESRFVEVSTISRELKALARELSCPVLALSQLNRESESVLSDGIPKLSQLRESGSLEQDADQVWLLSHPQDPSGGSSTAPWVDIHVAKNRHGSQGNVALPWVPRYQRFED